MTQTLLAVLSCVNWSGYCETVTQRKMRINTPSMTVSRRMKELRQKKGWSAAKLADACAEYGMPELNRSVIANIESRRRKSVTLEEAMTLAVVLDVSPLHLMVPIDKDEKYDLDLYQVADHYVSFEVARSWIRGDQELMGQDPRMYDSEMPQKDFEERRKSDVNSRQRAEDIQFYREQLAKFGFFDRTDGDDDGFDSEES